MSEAIEQELETRHTFEQQDVPIADGMYSGMIIDEAVDTSDAGTVELTKSAGIHVPTGAQVAIAGVMGATWAYEISWLNEDFRADRAVDIIQRVGDQFIVRNVAVGASLYALTFALEGGLGWITAKTINIQNGPIGWVNKRMIKNTVAIDLVDDEGYSKSDMALGLAGGSTPVVIQKHINAGGRSYEANRKTAFQAAHGIAIATGLLGMTTADYLAWAAENGYIEQAQATMDGLENMRTWLGLFSVAQLSQRLPALWQKPETEKTTEETNVEVEQPKERVRSTAEKAKRYGFWAGVVGAFAVGLPGEVLHLVTDSEKYFHIGDLQIYNPISAIEEAGGWLANNEVVDTVYDGGSVLWDWRIYTAGLGALVARNRVVKFMQNRRNKREEVVLAHGQAF